MHRTPLIGATLALALLIPGTPAVRAHHSTADVVFEWNQILQDTVPVAAEPAHTPLLLADAHRDVRRDQHPGAESSSRITSGFATAPADRRRPPPPGGPRALAINLQRDARRSTPHVTSTRRHSRLVRRRRRLAAATVAANAILAWRQNDGWAPRSHPMPTPPVPGRWQRTPPAPPRPSRTCRMPRRWPWSPDPVPAAASADAAEPALRHRLERSH